MAKRQPITVAGATFKTKKALLERIQGILYRYQPEDALTPADCAFMRAVLERHPSACEKIGCGVTAIKVHTTDYGNLGFYLVRTDGSWTDFSFMHCLTPRTQLNDFKKACRNMVFPQIQEFKNRAFAECGMIPCAVSGDWLTKSQAHVDHTPPDTFEAILADFIAAQGIDPETVEIDGYSDGEMDKRLANDELTNSWMHYHAYRAKLRIVSAFANLSTIKRAANKGKA